MGAQQNGEDAGDFARGLAAGGLDDTKRHREIHRGGETGGRRADRSLVARGSRKRNEEAGAARNQRSCEFERANHRGDKTPRGTAEASAAPIESFAIISYARLPSLPKLLPAARSDHLTRLPHAAIPRRQSPPI